MVGNDQMSNDRKFYVFSVYLSILLTFVAVNWLCVCDRGCQQTIKRSNVHQALIEHTVSVCSNFINYCWSSLAFEQFRLINFRKWLFVSSMKELKAKSNCHFDTEFVKKKKNGLCSTAISHPFIRTHTHICTLQFCLNSDNLSILISIKHKWHVQWSTIANKITYCTNGNIRVPFVYSA